MRFIRWRWRSLPKAQPLLGTKTLVIPFGALRLSDNTPYDILTNQIGLLYG